MFLSSTEKEDCNKGKYLISKATRADTKHFLSNLKYIIKQLDLFWSFMYVVSLWKASD